MKSARQSNKRCPAWASRARAEGMCVSVLCALILIAGLLYPFGAHADETIAPSVSSGCEIDYPPFCILDEQGRAGGFSVELMRAALKAMGREVSFRIGPWADVRGWLERGEVDALPLVGRTPDREALFDFTVPYMTMHGAIVVRQETGDVHSLADLGGRRVGVMKGDNAEEFLRREDRGFEIVTTPTFSDAFRALAEKRCDAVVVQRLVAQRLLKETGLANLKIVERPVHEFSQNFCFAVKDGDRELLSVLNEGLALAVADGTHRRLHAKWFAHLELPSDRPIVVGGDHNYPPFEFLDEKGRPTGFTVELTRAIARETTMDARIQLGPWADMVNALRDGRIDALEGMFYSPERDHVLDFSPRYLVIHCVSLVRKGEGPPPTTLEELRGRDLVVQAEDAILAALAEHGIEARVTTVQTQEDVVRAVAEGRNDCGLATRFGALYTIKENGWTNIEVGDRAFYSGQYCYAVPRGNAALLAQFTEGLQVLKDSGEFHRIHEKWLGVYEPGISSRRILKYIAIVAMPLVFLAVLALLWSWSLRRQVSARTRELREGEQQLAAGNQQLRATERQLRQGLELLDATGRMAKVGGWEVDAKTLEVKWTEQTYRLHEVPLDRRPPLEEAINFFHPEEQPKLKDAIHRALEHGEPYDMETRFITAKGNHLWTRTYCEPEIIDGKTVRLKGVFQDITDRKRAEEELRKHREHLEELVEERTAELSDLNLFSNTILDTSPVGIVTYRADGQCVSANENTGPLIGTTREQVLGQNFRTLASWRESNLLAAADRCLGTGEPQRALISARTSFGKDVILDTRFARFMARGEPHLLLTFSDITDRVRAEENLKRYSAQLEAANRELEAFAYSVSHDLRAPLRSINGFSEALLEDYADKVDEQGKDHLRRVRAGAQRMGELIEDLLKLSRITRWEMKHRKVDISALARQTVASLHQSQPGRDVDVIIEEGVAADADIRLLRVVMENLLGNAWKFSGKTANARIEVGRARNAELGTRNAELPDDAVVYFVRDNGAGFDMDYADKLFGAFQRLHSTAEFEGSGIGLATVQRAVLRHGGRIWAEGEVGKGAMFYFTLSA